MFSCSGSARKIFRICRGPMSQDQCKSSIGLSLSSKYPGAMLVKHGQNSMVDTPLSGSWRYWPLGPFQDIPLTWKVWTHPSTGAAVPWHTNSSITSEAERPKWEVSTGKNGDFEKAPWFHWDHHLKDCWFGLDSGYPGILMEGAQASNFKNNSSKVKATLRGAV